MASIQRRTRNGKTSWVVRWYPDAYEQRSKSFSRASDARAFRAKVEGQIEKGEAPDPRRGNVPFAEVAEDWFRSRRDLAPTTRSRDRTYLDSLVLPYLGDRTVGQLQRRHVELWIDTLYDEGKAPATVRKAGQMVAAILARAVHEGLILRNVAEPASKRNPHGIEYRKVERDEPHYLTHDEVEAIVAELEAPRDRALVRLMAGTGLRIGEALALRWGDVDLEARKLTVARTVRDVRGKISVASTTKTDAGRRTVSLPHYLAEQLAALKGDTTDRDALVFPNSQGGVLSPRNWRARKFDTAVEAAGLSEVTPHDLRHTHVAWLVAEGVHIKAIQGRLGHSSIQVTLDIYGHLMEGVDESAAEAMDRLHTRD